MQTTGLRAVVIGAGWAGEGHTKALQANGVEVVAICARQQTVVQQVAERLRVPNASTDWRKSLRELKPDIVTIATPASLRQEIVEEAVVLGAHILCEKPLAVDATEAQTITTLVEEAGVRHAYGVIHRYEPGAAWAAERIAGGAIGQLREIHCIHALPFFTVHTPWTWWERLDMGGGALNNGGTHLFAMLERIVGGHLVRAAGVARTLRQSAPVLPDLHDFRQAFAGKPNAEEAATLDWHMCNADHTYTALLDCSTGLAHDTGTIPIMAHFNVAAPAVGPANGWYFYGDAGVLIGKGAFSFTLAKQADGAIIDLPTPQRLLDVLPQTGDDGQNKWQALVAEFVADIQFGTGASYPTFGDGWRYQSLIDAIRRGQA